MVHGLLLLLTEPEVNNKYLMISRREIVSFVSQDPRRSRGEISPTENKKKNSDTTHLRG